jgi:hypothetical protein
LIFPSESFAQSALGNILKNILAKIAEIVEIISYDINKRIRLGFYITDFITKVDKVLTLHKNIIITFFE